jgi:hypothetical protein
MYFKFYPIKKERFEPIKKNDSLSPGQYDHMQSFERTQEKKFFTSFSKYNIPTFHGNLYPLNPFRLCRKRGQRKGAYRYLRH